MNITLDFTVNKSLENLTNNQPVAIIPENIAKLALKALAKHISITSIDTILNDQITKLSNCKTIEESIQCSLEYIQERELINNINAENWDAYKVVTP